MAEPAPLHDYHQLTPSGGEAWYVETEDARRIRFAVWQGGENGTALVFPGRSEPIEKYSEPVARLLLMGFSVLVIDWRGHGLSARAAHNPMLGHVDSFGEYQLDLKAVMQSDKMRTLSKPLVLISHSTGCAIGLQAMQHGLEVERAVFSSPFWGAPGSGLLHRIVNAVLWPAVMLGLGGSRFPFSGSDPYLASEAFEGNVLTSCPDQYDAQISFQIDNPKLQLGGFSLRWILAAQRCFRDIRNLPLPTQPVLTILAGDENLVSVKAIREVGGAFPNGRFVEVEGGRHELFQETEEIRAVLWQELESFLS